MRESGIFNAAPLAWRELDPPDFTKWWTDDAHDDTHIVVYFLDRHHEEIYFVTGVPEAHWDHGLSFVEADLDELRAAFVGFHPEVQRLLEICPGATKWPLFDREPLPFWGSGRIVLIGDACHPMKPHMGQGAAIAIEDAAILVRCLEHVDDDYESAHDWAVESELVRVFWITERSAT